MHMRCGKPRRESSSYLAVATAVFSTFNPARALFFCFHVVVHLALYALPVLLLKLLLLWPLSAVEALFLSAIAPYFLSEAVIGRLFKARVERRQGPRLIKVVTHPLNHATLKAFGLSAENLYNTFLETSHHDFHTHLMENKSFLSCHSFARSVPALSDDDDAAAERVFRPLLYNGPLYDGNTHTILGAFRSFDYLTYQRETVRSFDGNPICLDYLFPETEKQRQMRVSNRTRAKPRRRRNIKALVVVLPGLTGTSREFYVQRMAKALYSAPPPRKAEDEDGAQAKGHVADRAAERTGDTPPRRREYNNIQVVVLNARGVGDTPLEQPQIFSALFTKDLRYVLEHELTREKVRDKFGLRHDIPIVGLAFSLGGLILTNYCGEEGLRAMRAQGLDPDDGNTTRYPPNLDDKGDVVYHYGGGRQPMGPPSTLPASSDGAAARGHGNGLGEGTASVLDAAITVTSPHNLLDGDAAMNTFVSRSLYGRAFYRNLLAFYERHKDVIQRLPGIRDREELFLGRPMPSGDGGAPETEDAGGKRCQARGGRSCSKSPSPPPPPRQQRPGDVRRSRPLIDSLRTVRGFDNHITAPHFGFDDCFQYYSWADNFKKFPFVLKTKMMCVVAANDPICGPPQPLPRYEGCAVKLEENKERLRAAKGAANAASLAAGPSPSSDKDPLAKARDAADALPSSACVDDDEGVSRHPGSGLNKGEEDASDGSRTLLADSSTDNGGLVYVEFPVGGHLGFVSTPLAELLGRPNEMERFVARSLESVIAHWYSERGRSADGTTNGGYHGNREGEGAEGVGEGDIIDDESDWGMKSFSSDDTN